MKTTTDARQHTPGPWIVGGEYHDGVRIETADGKCSLGTAWGEGRHANVEMFASAPALAAEVARLREVNAELLAAARSFVAGVAQHGDAALKDRLSYHTGRFAELIAKAEAAQ